MILSAEMLKGQKVENLEKTMRSSLVTIKKAILFQQHAQKLYFREFSGGLELRKSRCGVPISHSSAGKELWGQREKVQ